MRTIKALLHFILALAFVLPPNLASTSPLSLAARGSLSEFRFLAQHYGRLHDGFRAQHLIIKKNATQIASEGLNSAAESLIFLFVVTGVQLVRNELKKAHVSREALSHKHILALSTRAAKDVLESGTTWANIIGSVAVEQASAKPLQLVNAMIDDTALRPWLKGLIQSGIFNIISYWGWDALDIFLLRARGEITDPDDYEKTEKLGLLVFQAFTGQADEPETKEAKRLVRLVFSNLMRYLIYDPELRSSALYDVWRYRFFEGDNAAFLTGWIGGGAIGSAVAPGVGTFWGAVIGGVSSTMLPKETKDSLDDVFGRMRAATDDGRLETVRIELREQGRLLRGGATMLPRRDLLAAVAERMRELFTRAKHARELALTARFEILFRLFERMELQQETYTHAVEANDQATATAARQKIHRLLEAFKSKATETTQFYEKELQALHQLGLDVSAPEVQTIFTAEVSRLEAMARIMASIRLGILNMNEEDDKYLSHLLLTKAQLLGFKEEGFLKIVQ